MKYLILLCTLWLSTFSLSFGAESVVYAGTLMSNLREAVKRRFIELESPNLKREVEDSNVNVIVIQETQNNKNQVVSNLDNRTDFRAIEKVSEKDIDTLKRFANDVLFGKVLRVRAINNYQDLRVALKEIDAEITKLSENERASSIGAIYGVLIEVKEKNPIIADYLEKATWMKHMEMEKLKIDLKNRELQDPGTQKQKPELQK